MGRKKSMQEEVEKTEVPVGEQMPLIDVAPENAKEILSCARRYKSAQRSRLAAEKEEVAEKQKLLQLIRQAGVKPVDLSGKISFRCDHLIITVTPRDELVRVKEEDEEAA